MIYSNDTRSIPGTRWTARQSEGTPRNLPRLVTDPSVLQPQKRRLSGSRPLPQVPPSIPPVYSSSSRTLPPTKPQGYFNVRRNDGTSVFEDFFPPAQEVYDHLGDFFPEHGLDDPVPPPIPRKRSTGFWESKVEEVTAEEPEDLPPESSSGPKSVFHRKKFGYSTADFEWVRKELISEGTWGKVYAALNVTDGEMIAVKQVEIPWAENDVNDSRKAAVVEALRRESRTLEELDHPNIIEYLGFEETPRYLNVLVFILDYHCHPADGGFVAFLNMFRVVLFQVS